MGYWGDFVVLRSDRPAAELPPFVARPGCSDEDENCLTLRQEQPGGWQILQMCHYLPGDDYQWWLHELITATGAPVMIGTVVDSGICQVRALAPDGIAWDTFLDPRSSALPEFLGYYLMEEDAEDESDGGGAGERGGEAVEGLLASIPATSDQIARWAAQAGLSADPAALSAALLLEASPFVEDAFFQLIDACGLPGPLSG